MPNRKRLSPQLAWRKFRGGRWPQPNSRPRRPPRVRRRGTTTKISPATQIPIVKPKGSGGSGVYFRRRYVSVRNIQRSPKKDSRPRFLVKRIPIGGRCGYDIATQHTPRPTQWNSVDEGSTATFPSLDLATRGRAGWGYQFAWLGNEPLPGVARG